MSESRLVIPTAIPFERLRARELEECVYWLLDSMGAQELEWRVGTQGRSSADQGRDIEAHFHVASPDADLVRQKWWIECKGRRGTLEPSAVKESANNSQAMPDVDVLVIVTNTSFSNPTRNWVSEWQRSHRRPTVKLWDKTHLERLLCRYPAATLRVFAKALTPQGRLEVIRERFWQHSAYATREHLKGLWEKRGDLEWEGVTLLTAVVSEFANGSVNEHPWLQELECDDFLRLLRIGLASALSFCIRAEEAGIDQGPYLDGMGYLVLTALTRYSAEDVRAVLGDFLDIPEPDKHRAQLLLLVPIFSRLMTSVRDACTRDCVRVSLDLRGSEEDTAERYWDRMRPAPDVPPEEPVSKRYSLIMEAGKKPCNVGFDLNLKVGCPLLSRIDDNERLDLERITDVLKKVVIERLGPASPDAA